MNADFKIELADNHCHLHAPEYSGIEGTVFARAKRAELTGITLMSVDWPSFQDNLKIIKYWGKIYPKLSLRLAFGLDMELIVPNSDLFELEYFKCSGSELISKVAKLYQQAEELAAKEAVAIDLIGEIGLDHYWLNKFFKDGEISKQDMQHSAELQEELFIWQIEYASKNNYDLSIHSRAAEPECFTLLQKYYQGSGNVCFHSYTGSAQLMKQIINVGYKIGLNGIITYSSAITFREAVIRTIKEAILAGKQNLFEAGFLLETDSPFLIPSNANRDSLIKAYEQAINEPASVKYLQQFLRDQLQ